MKTQEGLKKHPGSLRDKPKGNTLHQVHMGWDFDIHDDPHGGKFDFAAILKSWEDLGISDEWCTILENTQNSF